MEINITQFFNDANPAMYSASRAEIGDNAGQITWNNSLQRATLGSALLDDADKLDAMRAWARASGGWNAEEIAAWSDAELNALFIQLISGDIRERADLCASWDEYYALAEQGTLSGCLFETQDGAIIYYQLEG